MKEKDSDFESCNESDCCCHNEYCDCSSSEESDASRSTSPLPPKKAKSSSQKNERQPSSSRTSISKSSPVGRPKPKPSHNSSLKIQKGSTAKEIESTNVLIPTKAEKGGQKQSSSQKVNVASKEGERISTEKQEKCKIIPTLLELDNKLAKTYRDLPKNENASDGSDLESDYFIENKVSKRTKSSIDGSKGGKKRKRSSEGNEVVRFTQDEDKEIISFIEKNIDMPRLYKHMNDTFPDRRRAAASFYGRRDTLFKHWKKNLT
ncbi:uncharacterized protein FA14DRAFT_175094 [Meira miltonrushii]|uniref:Uncharacterized protein n=1 Tax=Meira miltonrushii TaxID=1280837 RepID=A0A316V5G7_9BASI|nr:uncharacterized protein FA14DRAFT_175094 [Meira miltonrushii]PWN32268.1 hypothetical protein FA14DRAFT_175094 [Meira miltonrushii]